MHAVATPPVAPCTRTFMPGRSPARMKRARYAVRYAVGRHAASAKADLVRQRHEVRRRDLDVLGERAGERRLAEHPERPASERLVGEAGRDSCPQVTIG